MQRVANHQYLYRRGRSYYFRRAVPKDAAHAFGGRPQVVLSLKTDSLSHARHALSQCLRSFDRTLAKARSRPDPTEAVISTPALAHEPDREEVDAAVRAWLRSVEGRFLEELIGEKSLIPMVR